MESVVALTVAPRYIDLTNSDSICLIAYETRVNLVQQKILQLDALAASAVKLSHSVLWVNLILFFVYPAFVREKSSQKLGRTLEQNFI